MIDKELEEIEYSRRELYLKEWEISTSVFDAKAASSVAAAVDFAALGIKSLYLLHGGALVALPAFYDKMLKGCSGWIILVSAVSYAIGMIVVVIANILSYFTMCYCEKGFNSERRIAAENAYKIYYCGGNNECEMVHEKKHKEEKNRWGVFRKLRFWSIIFAVISLLMFILGSGTMLYGAFTSFSSGFSNQDNLNAESTTVTMPTKSSRKSDGHLFLEWPCERFRFDVPGGMELGGPRLPCLTCGGLHPTTEEGPCGPSLRSIAVS